MALMIMNKVILGDCSVQMKKIPIDSINLVLTDPPYPDYYAEEYGYADRTKEQVDKHVDLLSNKRTIKP